jgi:transcriptional accessory protein Tex/SPT6
MKTINIWPLDDTRIHPEDYELARKMARHTGTRLSLIMQDEDNEKKLNELNLDEFAVNMFEAEDHKWHTLNVIRAELLKPFSEQRAPFPTLGNWDVLTMLSGETLCTLQAGLSSPFKSLASRIILYRSVLIPDDQCTISGRPCTCRPESCC